jgi:hypothetical protein
MNTHLNFHYVRLGSLKSVYTGPTNMKIQTYVLIHYVRLDRLKLWCVTIL